MKTYETNESNDWHNLLNLTIDSFIVLLFLSILLLDFEFIFNEILFEFNYNLIKIIENYFKK